MQVSDVTPVRAHGWRRFLAYAAWIVALVVVVALTAFAVRELAQSGVPITVTVDGDTETVRSARPDVSPP